MRRLRDLLTDQATGEAPDEEQVGPYTCAFPEHKQRVTFLEAPRDPLGFLDALKVLRGVFVLFCCAVLGLRAGFVRGGSHTVKPRQVADVLIIGMDAVEGVDEYGSYLVTLAHAQVCGVLYFFPRGGCCGRRGVFPPPPTSHPITPEKCRG